MPDRPDPENLARQALATMLPACVAATTLSRGAARPLLALSPARVNLIGEHVDYNDGFVLPVAIDRYVAVAFAPRTDGVLRAHATAFGETCQARVADLEPGAVPVASGIAGAPASAPWFAYVAGVAWALREAGLPVGGADLAIAGDAPIAAGLGSSAALELAVARALCATADIAWEPITMARLAQRAETLFVGVHCGVMDQLASACAREGQALLLDCRSLGWESVPLPTTAAIVVLDTGVLRSLAGGTYNERRASCEEAVRRLRALEPALVSLRDATSGLIARGRGVLRDPADPRETLWRRARHVVEESARPGTLAAALRAGDLIEAGRLMDESHASLRDLYEVSCPQLDLIVDLAHAHPACFGARLTGAGFGGCAVALVAAPGAVGFAAAVQDRYRKETGRAGSSFVSKPVAGTRLAE